MHSFNHYTSVRVGLEGARPRTTTHDHARPHTTTHDHARPRTTTHYRPRTTAGTRTTTHDRPRTNDRARTTAHDRARPTTQVSVRRLPYLFGEAVQVVPPCERLNTNFHSIIRLANWGDPGSFCMLILLIHSGSYR